ncbi:UDP-N-acetylglucosamine 1-carboxyvinyltransferase [Alicyclobacillus fodiniaquatilis]|uniref:UDP-N-acetylglucosamine 1-carboxyvinyltransferase n=1 Tax=Alicyclobacillus fodiniaquatilis TaxID=1661150 RepID=A0ABW4JH46_9BACL
MTYLRVIGGVPLSGTVQADGSKNSILPIMAACLLADSEESVIEGAPALTDIDSQLAILTGLGAKADRDPHGRLHISASNIKTTTVPFELAKKLRASYYMAGALLARVGHFKVALPGGCNIGERPVDQHIKGFEALGATVKIEGGYLIGHTRSRLKGNEIYLDIQSHGATINIILAATLATGQTIIENASKEPEIVDLCSFLIKMGADIRGAGTNVIRIQGVDKLTGQSHRIIPDRMEAGTYMIAAAMTRGSVYVERSIHYHLSPLCAKLREMGVTVIDDTSGIYVNAERPLKPTVLKTLPFPGFPTDLQAQMTSLLAITQGTSMITETVFSNRFQHVPELIRMGASMKVEGQTLMIDGVRKLSGAHVKATDLRSAAALALGGLAAEGETIIDGLDHLDRGYSCFEAKLQNLGASVHRFGNGAKLHLVSSHDAIGG